ncbi:Methyltransferase domain-containing protein [Polynucleobacter victoriensis]|uniref:Methyltransferase domain-containing protein n=2 Tax=Polynucleobacter victoriensis TaxID=2049319 RepID=A0A212T811_9BURK|nr:Methyltransferase domain-containing protein [Polynucleobacter victoriensis]
MRLYLSILKSKIFRFFGRSLRVKDSWEGMPSQFHDMASFLNWFDAAKSVDESLRNAEIDWDGRFKQVEQFKFVPKKNALEIGFGGGRLLSQSAKDFGHVYGVDIHHNFEMSKLFLNSQGIKNFTLLHRDQIDSVPDGSIDFVYSFIVFQHFDSMDEVDFYLDQIDRILSTDGVAHIYFGKNQSDGIKVTSEKDFILRDCSLFINPVAMRDRVSTRFNVIAYSDVLPKKLNGDFGESVQAMILFKKQVNH